MKLRHSVAAKNKLSSTLKSWLPILQSGISDLEDTLHSFMGENPYVSVKSNIAEDMSSKIPKKIYDKPGKNSITDKIESLTIKKDSMFEHLIEQINPPLFPTKRSQEVALEIVEHLDEDGYFDGDIASIIDKLNATEDEVEKIRGRFAYLSPCGIGAKNIQESLHFQLLDTDTKEDVYQLVKEMVDNLENMAKFKKNPLFNEALKVVQSFRIPPALEYQGSEELVIPDIFVYEDGGMIEVHLNDKFYPEIEINVGALDKKHEFVKAKIKEAKDLVDALEMRKATLYKIGLMIVEYQYDFFTGGEIKPMKLKDLAEEFGHAPSTISRAIAGKYLECNKGIVPIKSFFTTALDEDLSNASIKDYIEEIVKNEPKGRPLSDIKILEMVEKRFDIKMVRRTITKYRKQLNIASSSERKKLYEVSVV